MRALIGLLSLVGGVVIWGLAISALVSWLVFCFGSVIIGILLLIFAPYVLLAPLAIGTPGTALFVYGMDCIANKKEDSIYNRGCKEEKHGNVIEADVVWERTGKEKEHLVSNSSDDVVARKNKTKDPDYIRCSDCKFEQWTGYKVCQKCGVHLK
jgi:hypothetical protein